MRFYKEKLYNGIFNQHIEAFDVAISALREQGGSFQNGNDHNAVKDWPPYMDLPRDRDVTDINVGNKWISVKRQRPQYKQRVLFVTKAGEVSFAKDFVDWDDGSVSFWDVATDLWVKGTHWMPLPEPPKEEV